jgi:hypothetical protein
MGFSFIFCFSLTSATLASARVRADVLRAEVKLKTIISKKQSSAAVTAAAEK